MAEYCSICTPEYFDYNVAKMALELPLEHVHWFLCEGCYTRGVFKDHDGSLYIIDDEMAERKIIPVNIEDL